MKGFVGIIIPYEDIHELVVEEEFIQFITYKTLKLSRGLARSRMVHAMQQEMDSMQKNQT
jgi:hypothetical protein